MKKYLFLLTIPTVQAFIKQARKTQDLYVGSQLLSDLIKCGAEEFIKTGKLIFPTDKAETFTNRFLGEISTETPENIAKDVERAIKNKLIGIAKNYVEEIIGKGNLPIGFNEQIENLLDIKWAFVEWDGKLETYEKAYKEIEKIIGAIKNVRTFKQYNYQIINDEKIIGERGRKCSIDGERNVKFYRMTDDDIEKDKKSINHTLKRKIFLDNKDEICFVDKKVSLKHIDYGEGLSAVSFFKRCYIPKKDINEQELSFPETAKIAQFNIVEFFYNFSDFKLYKSLFKGNFDYQFIYKENINAKYFEKHKSLDFSINQKSIENLTESIFKGLKKNKLKQNKYYAVLVFDGDSMGKWLSGKKLVPGYNLQEFHNKLSEKLSSFSNEAEKILISPKGKAVYSGGDDFMGFVNLEHLFPVMKEINELFDTEVNNKLTGNPDFTIKHGGKLTLSAGIAIAHYKTPLSIVLEKAREMEKQAKQNDNEKKNSFAIAVLKRSGEVNQTVWKWKQNGEKYTSDIFENLVTELQNENGISNTFIKNTQIEFAKLHDKEGILIVQNSLLQTEFERLLKKSRDKKMPDENLKTIFENLKSLLPNVDDKNYNIKNFFMALNIADFIKRNTNGLKNS